MRGLLCILMLLLFPFSGGAQVLKSIRVKQADTLIINHKDKGDLLILDVRTKAEYNGNRIAGAVNQDFWSQSFVDSISKLQRDRIYLVYCTSGVRSKSAMKKMGELGFQRVYNLKGGIWAWRKYHGNLP